MRRRQPPIRLLLALALVGTTRGFIATDSSIRTAVAAWLANPTAAEATYGHISTWDTSRVTDMWALFEDASSFNEGKIFLTKVKGPITKVSPQQSENPRETLC